MREERLEPGGVPTRLYDPGGAQGLLLLGHGGAHGKDSERFVGLCRRYAAETGLAVVCIDAVDHGERRPAGPLEPGLPAGWHSRAVPRMVGDWQRVSAALGSVGPALAYVGFSMGSIFGVPIVAALPSVRVAVFVVGGVPADDWVDDPALEGLILDAAARLSGPEVLMLNMSRDEIIPTHGSLALFNAVPGPRKRLVFWDGHHDDWSIEAIGDTIGFISKALVMAPSSKAPSTGP